VQST
jgi:hypothetical protein